MAVTNAMEKTRLALFHIGKIIFAQATELLNPAFNRGLPPSVAATDPSTNYHAKGVQSAEMHNQGRPQLTGSHLCPGDDDCD